MLLNLAVLLFLLSPIFCFIFLIKPQWFRTTFKNNFSRKKILVLFTAIWFGSVMLAGASPSNTNVENSNSTVPSANLVAEPQETETVIISPTPVPSTSPTILPSSSPLQIIKPSPTPKSSVQAVYSPKPTTRPQPTQNTQVRSFTAPTTNTYTCNCSKTCTQISSCDEAYYLLRSCGCSARDGDNDGVPCENMCPGG